MLLCFSIMHKRIQHVLNSFLCIIHTCVCDDIIKPHFPHSKCLCFTTRQTLNHLLLSCNYVLPEIGKFSSLLSQKLNGPLLYFNFNTNKLRNKIKNSTAYCSVKKLKEIFKERNGKNGKKSSIYLFIFGVDHFSCIFSLSSPYTTR